MFYNEKMTKLKIYYSGSKFAKFSGKLLILFPPPIPASLPPRGFIETIFFTPVFKCHRGSSFPPPTKAGSNVVVVVVVVVVIVVLVVVDVVVVVEMAWKF